MNFFELSQKLGQNIDRLKNGEPIQSLVQINSIEEYKELFGTNLSPSQRDAHSAQLANNHDALLNNDDPNGRMARLSNFIYGNGDLKSHDADAAGEIFPVRVDVISQAEMIVSEDKVFGPSAVPVVLNIGKMTFASGSITALNTILFVTTDMVTFQDASSGGKPYHFGILGTTGTPGADGANGTSLSTQASTGRDASAPTPGICTGAGCGGTGITGANGGDGNRGEGGGDGKPNLLANLTFRAINAPGGEKLVIYTCSGAADPGGRGGVGGFSQQGGNGGRGCDSGCEGTDGGSGKGGNGGNGGKGGDAVNGNDVFVNIPSSARSSIVTTSDIASYGRGGLGGLAGRGGACGSGGGGGKHSTSGPAGASGNDGTPGPSGKSGTRQGNPGLFHIAGSLPHR